MNRPELENRRELRDNARRGGVREATLRTCRCELRLVAQTQDVFWGVTLCVDIRTHSSQVVDPLPSPSTSNLPTRHRQ
ncbi:hypothetical protein DPEC_G00137080 [Dallia pectoralis]|uniref:Uncharacterized protein n=1 Tax=Dallia pectoralis TaxID=75939 RepID=A0ACC2GLV0_DALPE|nr:hypothetical protein DPEC_G00137080 [Dallia pectoralis]